MRRFALVAQRVASARYFGAGTVIADGRGHGYYTSCDYWFNVLELWEPDSPPWLVNPEPMQLLRPSAEVSDKRFCQSVFFGSIVTLVLQFLGITSIMMVLMLFLLHKTYSDISAHPIIHNQEEKPDASVLYL
jgi:hypothetical protein